MGRFAGTNFARRAQQLGAKNEAGAQRLAERNPNSLLAKMYGKAQEGASAPMGEGPAGPESPPGPNEIRMKPMPMIRDNGPDQIASLPTTPMKPVDPGGLAGAVGVSGGMSGGMPEIAFAPGDYMDRWPTMDSGDRFRDKKGIVGPGGPGGFIPPGLGGVMRDTGIAETLTDADGGDPALKRYAELRGVRPDRLENMIGRKPSGLLAERMTPPSIERGADPAGGRGFVPPERGGAPSVGRPAPRRPSPGDMDSIDGGGLEAPADPSGGRGFVPPGAGMPSFRQVNPQMIQALMARLRGGTAGTPIMGGGGAAGGGGGMRPRFMGPQAF